MRTCSHVLMFSYSHVFMFSLCACSHVILFRCSDVCMFACSHVRMFSCSHVRILACFHARRMCLLVRKFSKRSWGCSHVLRSFSQALITDSPGRMQLFAHIGPGTKPWPESRPLRSGDRRAIDVSIFGLRFV